MRGIRSSALLDPSRRRFCLRRYRALRLLRLCSVAITFHQSTASGQSLLCTAPVFSSHHEAACRVMGMLHV
eukprot:9217039-Prorocentrum_lima.AAC.1